jgi:prepilin-type N-terminal cleavage/methylation domain-containing protein
MKIRGINMIRQKKIAGFTLIEVMSGMVLLSVGLLLLLPMMVTSIKANNYAKNATEASMLIKDKMEDLKNMNTPNTGNDVLNGATRNWTSTQVSTGLWRLSVTVGWNDEQGYAHANTMTSYMSTR